MKDLMKLAIECMEELDAIGIEYAVIESWTVNTRAKNRWGQTVRRDGKYYINISSVLLQDSMSDENAKATIIHELLHTCKGCMNHGEEWKALADLVNDCYSCYKIQRCTSAEDKGIIKDETYYKYAFKCSNCGAITGRDRESKFTKLYSRYGCARCGKYGTWERI